MFESRVTLLLCPVLLACAVAGGQVPIVNGDGVTFDDLIRERTFVTIVLKDPAGSQVPIVNGDGVTFEDLIREKTFVTIVLKPRLVNRRIMGVHETTMEFQGEDGKRSAYELSGIQEVRVQDRRTLEQKSPARHINARITGVYKTTMGVQGDNDKRSAYELSGVQLVRVQDGRIPTHTRPNIRRAFTEDERTVIDRAAARALEIFEASKGNQGIRIQAALVLAASLHESERAALRYLQELAAGNDVPTAITATVYLYLAGVAPDPEVVKAGFGSGSRQARGLAATLTGLTKDETFLPQVKEMLHDPMPEIFVPAAIAIGRLDERSGLPELYKAMGALTEVKGEAAVVALSEMGGEEVHRKMLEMLDRSKDKVKTVEWFRVLRVLYALGDDRAKVLMKKEALVQPAYQRAAALLLAADGVWEGTVFLRDYLDKAEDPNLVNLMYRAKIAVTLYMAGDIQEKNRLQELVNTKPGMVYQKGFTGNREVRAGIAIQVQLYTVALIGETGSRDMLSLLAVPVESGNDLVAIAACGSVMAISNPEFGARFSKMQF